MGYGGLHMLHKPVKMPSKYLLLLLVIVRESSGKYNIFSGIFNFHDIKK